LGILYKRREGLERPRPVTKKKEGVQTLRGPDGEKGISWPTVLGGRRRKRPFVGKGRVESGYRKKEEEVLQRAIQGRKARELSPLDWVVRRKNSGRGEAASKRHFSLVADPAAIYDGK